MSKPKRKHAAPPRPTQALVRVASQLDRAVRKIKAPAALMPTPAENLNESIALGALGLVELKLTAEEEKVLAEPVNIDDVLIKPTGQPYLSHPSYTKWFNRAFGRLGWTMVPSAKPAMSERGVVMPYVMYVHGKPVAFAMGEQDYSERNREQTYGDAIEATVASGMRRCAKRLGVGLELWDKRFLNRFIREHCILVLRTSKNERAWRRVDDEPFYDEAKAGGDDQAARPAQRQEPAASSRFPPRSSSSHREGKPITEKQVGRLWTIVSHAGRTHEEVNAWLKSRYGLTTSKAITMDIYDAIVRAVESRGELPPGPEALAREAGQEG